MSFRLTILCLLAIYSTIVSASDKAERLFKICANCHTVQTEGQYRLAPPLNDIVGREIASIPDFKYSQALKSASGVWTIEKLDTFLKRPNHAIADTNMHFRGLSDALDRKLLINWLATVDIPAVIKPSGKRQSQSTGKDAVELFRPCIVCHSYTKNASPKIGPNLYGIYGRNIASEANFDYSEALLRREGVWDEQQLNAFFMEAKRFDQGTHAAFQSLSHATDRETLINFLKLLSANTPAK